MSFRSENHVIYSWFTPYLLPVKSCDSSFAIRLSLTSLRLVWITLSELNRSRYGAGSSQLPWKKRGKRDSHLLRCRVKSKFPRGGRFDSGSFFPFLSGTINTFIYVICCDLIWFGLEEKKERKSHSNHGAAAEDRYVLYSMSFFFSFGGVFFFFIGFAICPSVAYTCFFFLTGFLLSIDWEWMEAIDATSGLAVLINWSLDLVLLRCPYYIHFVRDILAIERCSQLNLSISPG